MAEEALPPDESLDNVAGGGGVAERQDSEQSDEQSMDAADSIGDVQPEGVNAMADEESARKESSLRTNASDMAEDDAEKLMLQELAKMESPGSESATPDRPDLFGSSAFGDMPEARHADFQQLTSSHKSSEPQNLDLLLDVNLPISIELGRTSMTIQEILNLGPGSVVELNKLAGEPVDLLVNNKIVAKGEVVVIDENFGLRVTTLISPEERLKSLAE
jgi:flagellar motor switch protein FliN/FliY